ncbi:TetR/AcrR family transcriptional regulator [Acidicapsa acidisoli]|uniref:TetR/AcrR family transcriptional regulator n=1 Tax=Acidicapsa acidisoli TaxID=1615681 RepID=UPI0021E09B15|nr:TetR/AcrR family transcriptional regulator [Acidicapsa acidisoli]
MAQTHTLSQAASVQMAKPKNQGHRCSEDSKQAILSAVLELAKEMPLPDITVEAIARRAGVGKTRIYKWWPRKAYVAANAFAERVNRTVSIRDSACAERDLKEYLSAMSRFYASPATRILVQYVAEGQSDGELVLLSHECFLEPRREWVGIILDRAVNRGEISVGLDRELVLDLIFGSAIYRLITHRTVFEPETAAAVVTTLFRGLGNKHLRTC